MKTVPKRDMRRALRHLRQADPVMEGIIGRVVGRVGPIEMVLRRGRFLTLVRSIIGQQISTSAARSINERVRRAVRPRWVTPDSLAELSDKDLRSLGVSPQKIGYLRDLADAVVSRRVRLDRIHRLDDEGVIEEFYNLQLASRYVREGGLEYAKRLLRESLDPERAAHIIGRKFKLPVSRVVRALISLFSIVADTVRPHRAVPQSLSPPTLPRNLISSDWDPDEDPYPQPSPCPATCARKALFRKDAPWIPLKNVGSCILSPEELVAAFDKSRRRLPKSTRRRPPPPPSPSPISEPMRQFLLDMRRLDLIQEVDVAQSPATCRVSIIPKTAVKARAIANLAWLNSRGRGVS